MLVHREKSAFKGADIVIDDKRVCKLYILYDSDGNPFRNLLSYALGDVALQKSIIALASRHFANTGYSFDQIEASISHRFAKAELDALQSKKQAIDALSRSLSHTESYKKDATLAAILLLIFLDLLESGIDGWSFHIQGAKVIHQLLAELGSNCNVGIDRGETAMEIRQFITRQLFLYASFLSTCLEYFSLTATELKRSELRSQAPRQYLNALSKVKEAHIMNPSSGAF